MKKANWQTVLKAMPKLDAVDLLRALDACCVEAVDPNRRSFR
jgi:hypothetical protein